MDRRSFLSGAATVAALALLRPPRVHAAAADLDFASALEAARAIRAGQVSSVELTSRMLARIAQYNPKLNSLVTLTPDAALARARAADEARARGEWWGPFHGVPATIKDTFETAGVRTTAGATMFTNHYATAAARLANEAELMPRLRAQVKARSMRDLETALRAGDVLHAPVNDYRRYFDDAHVAASGAIAWFDHPQMGRIPLPRIPGLPQPAPSSTAARRRSRRWRRRAPSASRCSDRPRLRWGRCAKVA